MKLWPVTGYAGGCFASRHSAAEPAAFVHDGERVLEILVRGAPGVRLAPAGAVVPGAAVVLVARHEMAAHVTLVSSVLTSFLINALMRCLAR